MSIFACLIWALGAIFYCYEYYLRVAPSVMTSDLALAYQADATTLGNLSAFYYYAYVIMQIPVGILMDRYGPRKILTIACVACALGTWLFCATSLLWVAAIGRFLVGFGSAFAYVGVLKLTTLWLPPRVFAMFAGFATALGMLGAISGDIVMTSLVEQLGWKQTVYYSAIIGVFLTPMLWFGIPEDHTGSPHYQSSSQEEESIIGGLIEVVRNPQMWLCGIYGCCGFIVISAFAELWSIPFLRDVHHLSPQAAAYANSAIFLGFAIGGPMMGFISDTIGRRKLPMIIGAVVASVLMLALIYMEHMSFTLASIVLFFAGFFASAQVLVFALGRDNNRCSLAGTAVAFTNMVVMMGGVVLQPLIGKILDSVSQGVLLHGLRVYSASDYQTALLSIPILLLFAGTFVCLALKETYCEVKQ